MTGQRRFWAKGLWVDRHFEPWITTIVIMIHFGLGTAIIAGGPLRFTLPSYSPLLYYVQGQTWIYGIWIFASAILMAFPFRWLNIIGLWIGMFWHIAWMACFAIAAFRFETAAATPIPVYGGLAFICAALLTARIIDVSKG